MRKRRAIAIFEGVNHRGIGLISMPGQLPAILVCTPVVRPFRWSRLLFTKGVMRPAQDRVRSGVAAAE